MHFAGSLAAKPAAFPSADKAVLANPAAILPARGCA
jgi:hypothetical protein